MGKKIYKDIKNGGYYFHCPACGSAHKIVDSHKLSGTLEQPTFFPSVKFTGILAPERLHRGGDGEHLVEPDGRLKGATDFVCHSLISNGWISFLKECTHHFKGKTVELPDFE